MRISVAVVFDSLENRFFSYTEDQADALLKHLEKADLVVGFNIKRFDYSVLRAYTGKDLKTLATFDILEDLFRRLGFRLGLDHLAAETLDKKNPATGSALEWFKKGEMEKLTDYCRHDVEITRDLFEYGLKNGTDLQGQAGRPACPPPRRLEPGQVDFQVVAHSTLGT